MTPEGRVKKRITACLKSYGPELYYFMPVPGGFGPSSLDYVGCFKGRSFFIEAKAPGKQPTPRQAMMIACMKAAGAAVFVIDDPEKMGGLILWLGSLK